MSTIDEIVERAVNRILWGNAESVHRDAARVVSRAVALAVIEEQVKFEDWILEGIEEWRKGDIGAGDVLDSIQKRIAIRDLGRASKEGQ